MSPRLPRSEAPRDATLDWMRAVAILAVLVIHSATRYAGSPLEERIGVWLALVSRPAIAVFLFLSGALFVVGPGGHVPLGRRLRRVVLPYLFFSLFALVSTYREQLAPTLLEHPQQLLADVALGNTFGIYYFVFVIVCLYLLGDVALRLGLLPPHSSATLGVTLLLNVLHVTYGAALWRLLGGSPDAFGFYADRSPLVWGAFFFLGVWYRQHGAGLRLHERRWAVRTAWIIALALYSALFVGGASATSSYGYHSLIGTAFSLSTVSFLLTYRVRHAVITFLSGASYYLYLSHIFFVYSMASYVQEYHIPPSLWLSLVSFLVSLLAPIGLYLAVRRLVRRDTRLLLGA